MAHYTCRADRLLRAIRKISGRKWAYTAGTAIYAPKTVVGGLDREYLSIEGQDQDVCHIHVNLCRLSKTRRAEDNQVGCGTVGTVDDSGGKGLVH